ncbi:acyl-CoA thioesterase [Dysgonomonas sp. OttesenSCG-928-M03]|nr:acyl-CoA thioesterase [Dysgonomonas sp. OttesenSCG-928-M03]
MAEISFKHTIPLQLRANDIDRFGHINNTVYFTFYDLGKTNYIETICPNVDWEKDAIIVVRINVEFKSQIFETDHIAAQTTITAIGTKSFELTQRIIDIQTGKEKCICHSTMVTYDLIEHKSKPIPPDWIRSICAFEGKNLKKR